MQVTEISHRNTATSFRLHPGLPTMSSCLIEPNPDLSGFSLFITDQPLKDEALGQRI